MTSIRVTPPTTQQSGGRGGGGGGGAVVFFENRIESDPIEWEGHSSTWNVFTFFCFRVCFFVVVGFFFVWFSSRTLSRCVCLLPLRGHRSINWTVIFLFVVFLSVLGSCVLLGLAFVFLLFLSNCGANLIRCRGEGETRTPDVAYVREKKDNRKRK